ncbi:MAG: asparagine synthase (glutamine-hydrolyzing) [Pyrinomonadaceae bacterium MAG19_C2-C3]|nr:asparagine synthase (glutamine-hydrolyzing) [Pyrinomonadaceae bacterium MAG19_C2-C3]
MCGINGLAFSSTSNRRIEPKVFERARDTIAHRGPDDSGAFYDGGIALGHRRLSIVDVAGGAQPMTNEDGSLVIIFNGEIYNHADYRLELEAKGHRYQTHCDTETILHLYEEHGGRVVDYLRGMFAFAIWDKRRRELFIARDRLGVKPLYYVQGQDGSLAFGSEMKAVLAGLEIKPRMNYAGLPDYLANHATTGETTLFEGVKRLLPGHTLRWRERDGDIEINRYWDVKFDEESREQHAGKSDAELVAEWKALFEKSVELRLMADVPLGMFLSGGIDSSAIAAVMSRLVREPVKTFSVAFAEREANEFQYARMVAEKYRTEHHEVLVTPAQFFEALPRLVWHEDEPIAHPSSVALYFVSELAARHVKVVLTGEGSDEMLAGYERYYKTVQLLRFGGGYHKLMPSPLRALIKSGVEGLPHESKAGHKLRRTFLTLEPDVTSLYFDNFSVFSRAHQTQMLTAETRERIGADNLNPYTRMREYFDAKGLPNLLSRMLYADTKTYLHELLMKQDQMSMAASIESRVPFLDHKLVEFSAALPERMKLRGAWNTKYILREAMKNELPPEILSRKKMGFPVPVGKWFRGEYRHLLDEYVTGERATERGIFNPDYLREIVGEHLRGANHNERLWALINFEMWQRRFIDGESESRNLNVEQAVTIAA